MYKTPNASPKSQERNADSLSTNGNDINEAEYMQNPSLYAGEDCTKSQQGSETASQEYDWRADESAPDSTASEREHHPDRLNAAGTHGTRGTSLILRGESRTTADKGRRYSRYSKEQQAPEPDSTPSGSEEDSETGLSDEPAPTTPVEIDESEIERPGFATHDRAFTLNGNLKNPGLYYHDYKEASHENPTRISTWIARPIHALAMTKDESGGNHGLLLRFNTSQGYWIERLIPMRMLGGSSDELLHDLLDQGFRFNPSKKSMLVRWLMQQYPDGRIVSTSSTGWNEDGDAFVLPNETIGNQSIRFQAEHCYHEELKRKGSLDRWRENVAAPCAGNPMLILAVSIALAGPLLKRAKLESQGGAILHLKGDSSKGKSTAAYVAASVWGAPTFRRTWRATSNGLESTAASLNDTCLILDEIHQADKRDIGAIVYMVANGTGKARGRAKGGPRKLSHWRLVSLSSGEKTLAAHMAKAGERPTGGQEARMFDVPATEQAYGVFDDLHGEPNGKKFSEFMEDRAATYYGHAGPAFVEKLLAEDSDLPGFYAALCEHSEFQVSGEIQGRVAKWFALVAMAGELATHYGLTAWDEKEAFNAAVTAFNRWCEDRGPGQTDDRQILDGVQEFIERHGNSRFLEKTDRWLAADEQPRINNQAGYWRDDMNRGKTYLFFSYALREAAPGYDARRIADALDAAGWIAERGPQGRQVQIKVNGEKRRVYAIRPAVEDA